MSCVCFYNIPDRFHRKILLNWGKKSILQNFSRFFLGFGLRPVISRYQFCLFKTRSIIFWENLHLISQHFRVPTYFDKMKTIYARFYSELLCSSCVQLAWLNIPHYRAVSDCIRLRADVPNRLP